MEPRPARPRCAGTIRPPVSEPPEVAVHGIIYLVGLVVIVLAILSLLGIG